MHNFQCHMGWIHEGKVVMVFAIVELSPQRKGVVAVAYQDTSVQKALGYGILTILQKLVASIKEKTSLVWSFPAYSATSLWLGEIFTQKMEHILSSFSFVTHQEKQSDHTMEKAEIWSRSELIRQNGWVTDKIAAAPLDNLEEKSVEKLKDDVSPLERTQSAILFALPERYVALDLETTGKHPSFARIIEVGAVKVDKGKVSTFHTFVNPQMKIPKAVRCLTGIEQHDVDQAPPPWTAIRRLYRFIGEIPLIVGHNVSYDLKVLGYHCKRFNIPVWKGEAFCTYRHAKKVLPTLESMTLSSVCQALHIQNANEHSALSDADASRLIFEKFFGKEEHIDIFASN